ncbi:MAG: XisI protein [Chloroflexi bacterium]|nr:XisI protein [Chloroflexota bacterium]
MDPLVNIVREEVGKYAGSGRGGNVRLLPVYDDERRTYAVTAVDHPRVRWPAGVVVLARVVGDVVVIEDDQTDRPLVDALLQRGVPREKIVLVYAGEPAPDADYSAG